MLNHLSKVFFCLCLAGTAIACSDDGTAQGDNNDPGWKLNNSSPKDMDPKDLGTDATPDVDKDIPPTPDMPPAFDMPTDIPPGEDIPDVSPPVDMPPAPDMTPDIPPVPDMSGGACNSNNDCARSEVCCLDLQQRQTCTPRGMCVFGGVCNNDNECSGANEECCDLSQFGAQTKVCTDRCMNNMQPTGCMNNNECGQGEVCCPSLQGSAMCQPAAQCQGTGGLCAVKADCLNNQECCGFGPVMVCLDQCGF